MPFVSLLAAALLAPTTPAPAVGCAEHIEGPGGPRTVYVQRDVVRGALTLLDARTLMTGGRSDRPSPRPRPGRPAQVRLGVLLAAGHRATVSIHPADRRRAALQYRFGDETQDGRPADATVDFVPCPPQTPRFSGSGTVGPATIWGGGLLVRSAGCVRLRLTVDGVSRDGVRLALGAACPKPSTDVPTASCRNRSMAAFPGGFVAQSNLIAGPLSIVGAKGAGTPSGAQTIRELGWWKSPVLVAAGRTVTVRVAASSKHSVRLTGYAGHGAPRAAFQTQPAAVSFRACSPNERSGSTADGRPVTFWSGGFAVRRLPVCAELIVRVDDEPYTRRFRLPFGAPSRCNAAIAWSQLGAVERLLGAAPNI